MIALLFGLYGLSLALTIYDHRGDLAWRPFWHFFLIALVYPVVAASWRIRAWQRGEYP